MTTPLEEIIKSQIHQSGPMDVSNYMTLALGHPKYGYYMYQDPFGVDGDFITAPEISQMFGEMIAAWLIDIWMQAGAPTKFVLLECGPGRGTLMADIMRVARSIPAFYAAANVCLLEMSPYLKKRQANSLDGYNVQWADNLDQLPDDCPVFFIANEFFDALPFRQYQYQEGQWLERCIGMKGNDLLWVLKKSGVSQGHVGHVNEGEIFEVSTARESFMEQLALLLRNQNGAGLLIDYGHLKTASGDTFQALYKNQYCNVFEYIGQADLTSHVDFDALARVVRKAEISIYPMVEQGAFLKNLGIEVRAQALIENASVEQKKDIEKALHRLISSDEMGALFKVMGIYNGIECNPAGF